MIHIKKSAAEFVRLIRAYPIQAILCAIAVISLYCVIRVVFIIHYIPEFATAYAMPFAVILAGDCVGMGLCATGARKDRRKAEQAETECREDQE